MADKLRGLIAASHTPMHPDGSVHYEMIESQVRLFRDNGMNGAFVCGTTGEGRLLNVEERKRVAACWLEGSRGDIPVVVHVGADCMDDIRELARHAQEQGAFAISTTAPSFYRPADVSDLAQYCRAAADAAPKIPFYFYHIPSMTHVNFLMLDFLKAAENIIPTLAGIKFTHDDFVDLFACQHYREGRYNLLSGRDEILLAALSFGADGAVGSTYNYAAPLYQSLIQAFREGRIEEARRLQGFSMELVRLIKRFNEIAAGKAIMSCIGVDCGSVRPPLKPLSEDDRRIIEEGVETGSFRPYLCRFSPPA
ncbi:MAG: dihydrodipicolinate synthase family protein [Candidatus Omnitrophica bacterium]|nr:dihydrodipicolinate synthase family protein [Candidatus Omnitrophota bacterium]